MRPRSELLADLRFVVIACGLNLPREEATARVLELREVCARAGSSIPTPVDVMRLLGDRGAEMLVRAQLADDLGDGRVSLRETERRQRVYAQRRSAAELGGRKRQVTAERDAQGRFLPNASPSATRKLSLARSIRESLSKKLQEIDDE